MSGTAQPNLKFILDDIKARYPQDVAITMIAGLLKDEYGRLDGIMRDIRQRYLALDVDSPADEHEIADLRLEALDAYHPAYLIEIYLAGMGADIEPLLPAYEGAFETSAARAKGWDLSFVSLREGAMRSLGGHCNVIGEVVLLERRLYHHMYLAAIMQPTSCDTKEQGDSCLEFHFSTVVFDEDVSTLLDSG
jgi:hypothetical protein